MNKTTENQASQSLAQQNATSDDIRDLIENYLSGMEEKDEPKSQNDAQEEEPEKNEFPAYSTEAQAELAKLPPHVQQFIKEREAQFNKGDEQYKNESQFARRMKNALSSHADFIKEQGSTPEEAVTELLHTEKTLRTGSPEAKTAMLQQLAHAYGIDINQAAQQPFDPRLNALEQQNRRLNSQIEHHQASQQDAQSHQIESAAKAFEQKNEHFEKVRPTMNFLLENGLASTIDEAYEKAVRMDDELYEKGKKESLEDAKRAQIQQANQAAKAAKAANVSVRGTPTGAIHAKPADTIEEQIRQNMKAKGLYN